VAAGEALGAHRSEARQDDVGDDGTHGHGSFWMPDGPVGPSPATPVAKASGWVFGINQALAALNAGARALAAQARSGAAARHAAGMRVYRQAGWAGLL